MPETADNKITRKDVLWRAVNIWQPYHVPYNMGAYSNGWRTDCSGYVSMCLNLTSEKPGASTETLVSHGHIQEIARDELRPGDMVGLCGPGTGGANGHIVLFDHWDKNQPGYYWGYEQAGPYQAKGPEHSLISYPYHGYPGYKPYRYRGIVGNGSGPPPHGDGQWVWVKAWPDPMSTIGGIAAHFGIGDWHKIWNAPENAGLRAHRMEPEHIQPGDGVWVPA